MIQLCSPTLPVHGEWEGETGTNPSTSCNILAVFLFSLPASGKHVCIESHTHTYTCRLDVVRNHEHLGFGLDNWPL